MRHELDSPTSASRFPTRVADAVLRRRRRPRPRRAGAGGAVTWRNDDQAHRVIVRARPGQRRHVRRVRGRRRRRVRRGRRAGSQRPASPSTRAPTTSARAAGSQRLARTMAPWGVRVELVAGLEDAATPYSSPLVPGGFLTDGVGFGHVVFATTAFDESHAFLIDGLGMAQSDWLEMEIAEASSSRCASSTATRATTPSPWPRRPSTCPRRCTTSWSRRTTATTSAPPSTGRGRRRSRSPTGSGCTTTTACSASTSPAPPGSGRGRPRRPDDHRRLGRQPPLRPDQRLGPPAPAHSHERRTDAADVVVVGCGPVGLTLAILLAQRGPSVTSSSAGPARTRCPGPSTSTTRSAASSSRAASATSSRRSASPPRSTSGATPRARRCCASAASVTGASGGPCRRCSTSPTLEAVLERRARELGVDIRRGFEVTGLSQHQDAWRSRPATATSSTAGYVVGCDGANSTVRTLLGMPMTRPRLLLRLAHRRRRPADDRVFDPINLQICDPARPTTVVSGGPGRRRWEFMRLDHETLDELDDDARWELLEPWDVRPGNATARAPRRLHVRGALRRAVAARAGAARRRRRPPDAALRRAGHVRRRPRRRQPRLEARPRAHRPGARRAARHLRAGAAPQRPPGDRVLHRARQGHLRPRPRRGRRPRRGHGRRSSGRNRPTPAAARHRRTASSTPAHPHAGSLFVQGTVDGRRFDDVHGAGWRLVTVDPTPIDLDRPTADGSRRSAAAW